MMSQSGTILITGANSCFGRALAQAALEEGFRVAGTVRNEAARLAFEALAPGQTHGYLLDLTDQGAIALLVERIELEAGPITVLVNNAGCLHAGTVEESPIEALEHQLAVNLIAPTILIQAILPQMRRRRAGQIVNVTTIGGLVGLPGFGFSHASRFALEGLTESLRKELKLLGIDVTAVEIGGLRPGYGRTSEPSTGDSNPAASGDSVTVDFSSGVPARTQTSTLHADYAWALGASRAVAVTESHLIDPGRAARALLAALRTGAAPAHLLLGENAVQWVREKIAALKAEITAWESVSLSAQAD
ncbi:SDR family NAD(P)-dependent oxidoreductase [Paraburkholderia fynbosensis]|uniref:3-phenylpropionate-dihydrodiol/cinnamic acid-dihydrodiol dehydrogenase n=1 Tax=Paraburkholderia fynbosensis TaxID=1200993 RepID=A0A6J5GQU3_9BURK|nr:SDR family NAD(P)-dependent oxidoreductase [Paraburkholderia fynbosensis]CAB3804774.1 hypothetical protein LMG27177_05741 [Paraburkholderia fynbosensis]